MIAPKVQRVLPLAALRFILILESFESWVCGEITIVGMFLLTVGVKRSDPHYGVKARA